MGQNTLKIRPISRKKGEKLGKITVKKLYFCNKKWEKIGGVDRIKGVVLDEFDKI